jgi:tRNA 2-thiouridine synthesizing protein A
MPGCCRRAGNGSASIRVDQGEHGMTNVTAFDKELDARGLNCPLPILRTKKTLSDMTSGQVLKIVATDPGSTKDFQAFAKQTGNTLLAADEADKVFTFFMQKK